MAVLFPRNPTSYFNSLLCPIGYKLGPWALIGMAVTKLSSLAALGRMDGEMEGSMKQHGSRAVDKSLGNRKEGLQERDTV